ncbi:MAG: hypothetical protein LWX02_12440 [Deltaproteobacteria bacterium]|nr:hypothetical protein [Deltaproteobacteria bacterium]
MELAEETLALFYEASDVIVYMRNPFSYGSETEGIARGENETEERYEARKRASIVFKRYNENHELFNKIHAMRYRFMAQIEKKTEPFEELRKIVNEIFISARMLFQLRSRRHFRTQEQKDKHYKSIERHEAIFYEGIEEKDPIIPRLNKLVSEIEITCNEIISGKGTLHGARESRHCHIKKRGNRDPVRYILSILHRKGYVEIKDKSTFCIKKRITFLSLFKNC